MEKHNEIMNKKSEILFEAYMNAVDSLNEIDSEIFFNPSYSDAFAYDPYDVYGENLHDVPLELWMKIVERRTNKNQIN